jgi:hypothetical protein
MPAKAGIHQPRDPFGTPVPCSHSSDDWITACADDDGAKLAPAGHRRDSPRAVAGPFDFRLGIDADVDRIGVFLPGIAHGC